MKRLSEKALEDTGARRLHHSDEAEDRGLASHRESLSSAPLLSLMRWGFPPLKLPPPRQPDFPDAPGT